MKIAIYLLSATLALSLNGCSDPAPAHTPIINKDPVGAAIDPTTKLTNRVDKALLVGSSDDLQSDRDMLRGWRRGGEARTGEWPDCEKVGQQYSSISDLKTMVGVKDALVAAQVDDYVLCDQPKIFASAKAGAVEAIGRLAKELPAAETAVALAEDPRNPKMDQCWLEALRDTRQNGAAYDQATRRAEARCTKNRPSEIKK